MAEFRKFRKFLLSDYDLTIVNIMLHDYVVQWYRHFSWSIPLVFVKDCMM